MSEPGSKLSVAGRLPGHHFLSRFLDVVTGRGARDGRSLEALIEDYLESTPELAASAREMITNILGFGALRVDDVMVPRADIVAVELSTSLDDLVALFCKAAHSRLPIYRETLDDPVGMVHIKDVLGLLAMQNPKDDSTKPLAQEGVVQKTRRDVLFVPPSMRIVDLLIKMQKTRIHMAIVVDEYGGTDGLATIEDLVEEIVGDIEDEHDVEETPLLTARPGGGYEASARLPIEDLEEALGLSLVPEDREEDIDTLGGLVFSLVGRVPQRGELIRHPKGVEFEIVDADPRRVKKVRVHGAGEKLLRSAEVKITPRSDDASAEAPPAAADARAKSS